MSRTVTVCRYPGPESENDRGASPCPATRLVPAPQDVKAEPSALQPDRRSREEG